MFSAYQALTLLSISGEHRKHHRPARNIGVHAAGGRPRRQKRKLLALRILRRDKQASLEDGGSGEAPVRRGLRRGQRMRIRSPGRVVDRLDSGQQVHHRFHADDHAARRRLQSRGTSVPDEAARLHRGPAIGEHPARVYGKPWQHPGSDLRHRQSPENECMMMCVGSLGCWIKGGYNGLFFRKH